MMKQCKGCFHYDEEDDDFIRSSNDQIIIGEDHSNWHYCLYFDGDPKPPENNDGFRNHIPFEYLDGEKKCPKYFSRAEMEAEIAAVEEKMKNKQ